MSSGDTLATFTALHNEPHSSSPALFDTRNDHPVLDMDATNNTYAQFSGVMPDHYSGSSGSGVDVFWSFAMSSATSGCCDFNISLENLSAQDLDSDGFASACTVNDVAVSGSSGVLSTGSARLTYAESDSIKENEEFRLRIQRVGGTDGAAGDAELAYVWVREV